MSTQKLVAIHTIEDLGSGAVFEFVHGLRSNGRPVRPKTILPDRGSPIVVDSADETKVSYRNMSSVAESAVFRVAYVHSFEADADSLPENYWKGSFGGAVGGIASIGPKGDRGDVGETGPQGPVGPQGPAGPQGPQGEPGADGADGLPGADGVDGEQGPEGPPGPQGERGDPGADGLDGVDGEPGPAGPAGEQGPVGPQGVAGDTGPQGPQGMQGPAGIVPAGAWASSEAYAEADLVTYGGNAYIAVAPSTDVTPGTDSSVWQLYVAAGTQGPQGVAGPAGADGKSLRYGPAAPTSGDGNLGDFWIDSVAWVLYGPKTAAGWPSSSTPLKGPKGDTGAAGPAGATGPAGAAGPAGPTGATGAAGPAGATGPQGPAGSVSSLTVSGKATASTSIDATTKAATINFTGITSTEDVGGMIPGKPLANSVIFAVMAPRPMSLPTLAADYLFTALTAPVTQQDFTVAKHSITHTQTDIGTVRFAANSKTGTMLAAPAVTSLLKGEYLTVKTPSTVDGTIANVLIAIPATATV